METDTLIKIIRRAHALEALQQEETLDRRDFEQCLGVSKPTVHRFTRSLSEQGLITKVDGAFTLTPIGEIVAEEVVHFHETMETVQKLRGVLEWLPVEEFDFDPRRFRTANVFFPRRSDPVAPIRRATALLDSATRVSVVSSIYVPDTFDALRRGVTEREQSVTCVYDQQVLDTIRADERATNDLRQLLSHGAVVTVHPDAIPFALGIVDETVLIGAIDDRGAAQVLITTEDAIIRAWAEEICTTYLREAVPVSVDTDARAVVSVHSQ